MTRSLDAQHLHWTYPQRAENWESGRAEWALWGNAPPLEDLWVARAVELAQRQYAITHALIKPTSNGKPVRMGASVVTHALTKRVQ